MVSTHADLVAPPIRRAVAPHPGNGRCPRCDACVYARRNSMRDHDAMTKTFAIYLLAALAEIAGCFGFWMWLRQDRTIWLLPGAIACLIAFAWLLSLIETAAAGRAYAAYGGIYIAASLAWLWQVEGLRPDRWDLLGASVCLLGATIIVFGPRTS